MKAVVLSGIVASLIAAQVPAPAPPPKAVPRLDALAETKLLMEGLAHPNFKGIERNLRQPPADKQTWTFARGQALLIGETANLLMIRPPRKDGQTAWFERAMELRTQASQLAKSLAAADYDASKAGLTNLANSCNRCHQTFRVPVRVEAFGDGPP